MRDASTPTAGVGAAAGGGHLTLWHRLQVFLRSFAIQGSWNERTMQGGGFGYALLPGLQALYPDDPAELDRAVRRHVEHFNAHPYLADLALGAVLRLEADGVPEEEIRRFKSAVRGPLGSLGDVLVWAGWLPACTLLALALALMGLGPWLTILVFLLLYNLGHLIHRAWVFRGGFGVGGEVGRWLRGAHLARYSSTVASAGSLLLGLVVGLGVSRGVVGGGIPWPMAAAASLLLGAGTIRGLELRRPAWIIFLSVTFILLLWGVLA